MVATFIEGFDYYTATGAGSILPISARWSIENYGTALITTGIGRYPNSKAMYMVASTTSQSHATAVIDGPKHTAASFGFSVKFNSRPTAAVFMILGDSARAPGVSQPFHLTISNTGVLTAFVNGSSVGSTNTNMVPLDTWIYIEVELELASTTGKCVVYINDSPVISATSIDTSAVTGADYIKYAVTNAFSYFVDDVYVSNTSTKLGESRVIVITPNADTSQKSFTPSDPTLPGNYAAVSGTTVDGESFIYAGTLGWKDYYEVEDLSFNPAKIHGVQPVYVARKDDSSNMNVRLNLATSDGEINGNTNGLTMSTTGYQLYSDPILPSNPTTSSDWKMRDITSIKIGPEIM